MLSLIRPFIVFNVGILDDKAESKSWSSFFDILQFGDREFCFDSRNRGSFDYS